MACAWPVWRGNCSPKPTTFNLGGGSNSGSQANVFSNPFAATLSNRTNNGTGVSFNGGNETFSFAGLPVNIGSNTLTFTYTSLADANHAGFQGLGDEGWGVEQVIASAVPEPSTWAMMLLGFAGIGSIAYRRKSKLALMAA
jgi:PEP-CTERM motif